MRIEPELNEFLTGRNQFTYGFLTRESLYFGLSQCIVIGMLDTPFSHVHSKEMISFNTLFRFRSGHHIIVVVK